MTGPISARSANRRSIEWRLSGSSPADRFPTSVGAIFRTNTEGFGTITTARLRCLPILSSVTYRPSALAGEFPARAIALGGGSSGWRDYGHAEAPRRGANGRLVRVMEATVHHRRSELDQ